MPLNFLDRGRHESPLFQTLTATARSSSRLVFLLRSFAQEWPLLSFPVLAFSFIPFSSAFPIFNKETIDIAA
ncbi:hypothetical protein CHH74_19280 [Shouchella clausii]|nr:hypothetical protein CHH74_19280 [Shouchella clausii]